MCGIAASIEIGPPSDFVRNAHNIQIHRGPDDEGITFESIGQTTIGLSCRRLAITDRSPASKQPMNSRSGRFGIVFNGEIFNYKQLADQFNIQRRTQSDTEVVIELIEELGLDDASRHFNGMWALVVLDRERGRILLGRDRFAQKPLSYCVTPKGILVASEVKCFLKQSGVVAEPDPYVAARYIAQGLQNVDERTWLKGVQTLPASIIAEIDLRAPSAGLQNVRSFWSITSIGDGANQSVKAYTETLRATLSDSVRLRLGGERRVGVALSGGVDSSTVAALSGGQAALLSVVHPGTAEDESGFIDVLAQSIRQRVTKISLEPSSHGDIVNLVERCSYFNDGPVHSMSAVLFYLLMQEAKREGIDVVLTGQGSDEAFCGYRKFVWLEAKRQWAAGQPISALSFLSQFARRGTLISNFRLAEAKRFLGHSNTALLGKAARACFKAEKLWKIDTLRSRQEADIVKYSVPTLCHYEDRMSMAHGVEVRSPYLDHRVVEFALGLPLEMKFHQGWSKYALRRAFEAELPKQNSWRKDKKGFSLPEKNWFKGEMHDTIIDFMSDPNNPAYRYELVDRENYIRRFEAFVAGSRTIWARDIFAPLSLALWLRSNFA